MIRPPSTGASASAGATGGSPPPSGQPAHRPAPSPSAAGKPGPAPRPLGATPSAQTPSPAADPKAKPAGASSPSVSGPKVPAKSDPFSNRNLIVGGSAAGVILLGIVLLIWKPWRPAPPRLNEEPYRIAKFAASSAMDDQPWSMQREYMDILDKKEEALLEAYKAGRLTDNEYRRSLQLGWYDKHLDRMEKFYERPPGRRMEYIDSKVLGKKFKEFTKNPGKTPGPKNPAAAGSKNPAAGAKNPAAAKKPKNEDKSDDLSPLKPEEIDRDNSTEEQDIKRWPADVKLKWIEYRAAVASRKEFYKERERDAKEARKKNAATTQSTTAPATATGTGAEPSSDQHDSDPSTDTDAPEQPASGAAVH